MPKKRTYITKSDLKGKKPWLKKENSSEYKIEKINPKKTMLIVCEGQTEELYFNSFSVSNLTVKSIGLGQSKLKLVDSTEKILEVEKYDIVWCVFDLDIKYDEVNSIPDFDNAIEKAKKLGYFVAYSNDAFELWFYLHYQFTDFENHRTFYYEQLSKLWDINYEKEGKKWKFCNGNYQRLEEDPRAKQKEAIKRAEKLFKEKYKLPYHAQNPVTFVYELVRLLNANMKK
jgi:hypothetical protein